MPAGVLRPPRLVGRDAECHAAQADWARDQVVAFVGEAGMGKTRLLQHLLPLAALAGNLVNRELLALGARLAQAAA